MFVELSSSLVSIEKFCFASWLRHTEWGGIFCLLVFLLQYPRCIGKFSACCVRLPNKGAFILYVSVFSSWFLRCHLHIYLYAVALLLCVLEYVLLNSRPCFVIIFTPVIYWSFFLLHQLEIPYIDVIFVIKKLPFL